MITNTANLLQLHFNRFNHDHILWFWLQVLMLNNTGKLLPPFSEGAGRMMHVRNAVLTLAAQIARERRPHALYCTDKNPRIKTVFIELHTYPR